MFVRWCAIVSAGVISIVSEHSSHPRTKSHVMSCIVSRPSTTGVVFLKCGNQDNLVLLHSGHFECWVIILVIVGSFWLFLV